MRTHNAFENVIFRDVFDLGRRECSVHRVAVCGASLGAWHAANIAFRHPDAVGHLISLSGSFATRLRESQLKKWSRAKKIVLINR